MRRLVLAWGAVPAAIAVATVPPDGGGEGLDIVREQAQAAATDFFAGAVEGGASHIVCEPPSADAAGVVFYCFGVDVGGAPIVAEATINEYGAVEIAAAGSTSVATPAPSTTVNSIVGSAQGSGSQAVQVDPISGPTIVTVTHDGAGAFAVQPQQGGVPAGAPLATVTGPWEGRYLVGLGGTISGFAITADGDWTLTIEQRSGARPFDAASGVDGENADVIAYDNATPWGATATYEGDGPIVIRAVTLSGSQELVNQAGPYADAIEVPAGPGFVTVEAPGAWALRPQVPATTSTVGTTASPSTSAAPPDTAAGQ
jgi:hypothetical protein